jgi:hypothetical protein
VDRAEEMVGAHDRDQALDLLLADEVRLEPPGRRVPVLSVQFFPALRRGGHLQAPDLPVDRLVVKPQPPVHVNRLHGELARRARDVILEDEPGRVRGRSAAGKEWPLVEHHNVRPSPAGQFVGGAAADDPRADDDDLGASGQRLRRRHA